MDWERINRLAHIRALLAKEKHSDQCSIEYMGDGLPCCCGFYDATHGLDKMIEAETKDSGWMNIVRH